MAELIAKIVEAAADVVKDVVSAAVRKGAELPQAKGRGSNLTQLKTPGMAKTERYETFSYAQLPFIINQQQKEEEEEKDEVETGRGDLLTLELKSHLSQLKTPGLSLKKQKKGYGKSLQDRRQNQNVSAEIYDLIRSILHIFPWFYNFLKGVIIIRSTKQS